MLPPIVDPNVLVGPETSDDAAVYRLTDELGLVLTVDYFTPIVDDPRAFGQIAAANSLSDVYAMGGRPIAMLSIVGFPRDKLPMTAPRRDPAGWRREGAGGGGERRRRPLDRRRRAQGRLRRRRAWSIPRGSGGTSAPGPGDALVLTKPLGTGIISTAIKQARAPERAVTAAVGTMARLNRAAAEAAATVPVHAATDVTGFGLLGHLRGMTRGSKVRVRLHAARIPLLPDVVALAEAGLVPGGTKRNLEAVAETVRWDPSLPEPLRAVIGDAQTSGGLLFATPDGAGAPGGAGGGGRGGGRPDRGDLGEDPAGTIEVAP